MELVGGEFTECVVAYRDVWLPTRNIVQKAIEKRQEVCTQASSCPSILTTMHIEMFARMIFRESLPHGTFNLHNSQ